MSMSVLALPPAEPTRSPLTKDKSPTKRILRAEIMQSRRGSGLCRDIDEARSWWRAGLYNLVLIDVENKLGQCNKFCERVRSALPPQCVAFLVGKPIYLANAPSAEEMSASQTNGNATLQEESSTTQPPYLSGGEAQYWGILKASRRISRLQFDSHARSKAIRERPVTPRDPEIKLSYSISALAELSRKEIQ